MYKSKIRKFRLDNQSQDMIHQDTLRIKQKRNSVFVGNFSRYKDQN